MMYPENTDCLIPNCQQNLVLLTVYQEHARAELVAEEMPILAWRLPDPDPTEWPPAGPMMRPITLREPNGVWAVYDRHTGIAVSPMGWTGEDREIAIQRLAMDHRLAADLPWPPRRNDPTPSFDSAFFHRGV